MECSSAKTYSTLDDPTMIEAHGAHDVTCLAAPSRAVAACVPGPTDADVARRGRNACNDLRLHHHRRGVGGMHCRKSPVRRSTLPRPAAGSRRIGPQFLAQAPGGL